MKKSILFLSLLLFGFPVHSTENDVEKRIRELETELKNLKQAGITLKADKLKKKIVDKENPSSNQVVENDSLPDEGDDLNDLLPLEENDATIIPVAVSSDKNTKKVLDNDTNNEAKTTIGIKDDRAYELYDQAKIMIGQKKLTQAHQILQEIITAYPDSPYYIIAYYWVGELALNNQDYMAASLAYGSIFEKYKAGQIGKKFRNRVAESLIKFSHCLKMLKKNTEACIIISEFYKEFKDVPRNITYFADLTHSTLTCPKS